MQFDMPIVTGKVNGQSLRLLIDTGASLSLISEQSLKNVSGDKAVVDRNPRIVVKGISGSHVPISSCVRLMFEVGGGTFFHDVYVTVCELSAFYDAIVGYDLLRAQGLGFDPLSCQLWRLDATTSSQRDSEHGPANTLAREPYCHGTVTEKVSSIQSSSQRDVGVSNPRSDTARDLEQFSVFDSSTEGEIDRRNSCSVSNQRVSGFHVCNSSNQEMWSNARRDLQRFGEKCGNGIFLMVFFILNLLSCVSSSLWEKVEGSSKFLYPTVKEQEVGSRSDSIPQFFGKTVRKEKIPPRSEKIISVYIPNSLSLGEVALLQPLEYVNRELFWVARSVNKTSKDGILSVKVINLSNQTMHLNKHMKLVSAEPVRVHQVSAVESQLDACSSWISEFDVSHLPLNQQKPLLGLLKKYQSVFAKSVAELGSCDTLLHRVHLTDDIPVRQRPYRVPFALRPELNRQINELLDANIIRPSSSPYSAPVLLVRKSDGSYRLCTDFRRLNAKTVPDAYPIPNMVEMVDSLAGASYFTSLDLTTGFYQMQVDSRDVYKTAFVTDNGLFEWLRVPFGMRNSPNSFQRLMEIVLSGLKPLQIGIYIDDIVIASKTFEEHLEKLEIVFGRLKEHNLRLKPDKCHFLKASIKYLGFIVSADGIAPDPGNLETVRNFKIPRSVKDVRAFLGLTGFYRRFIKDYAELALPLTNLTKGGIAFAWNPEAAVAFENLKQSLLKEPCLKLPDLTKEFVLACDASKFCVGAVLQQADENGSLQPVAYVSRKLKGAEISYSTVEKEMLAVVFAVSYFRQFLYARHFTVITDQASLSYAFKLKDPTSRIARWCMSLQQFDYKILHRPGKSNVVADYLSRSVQATSVTSEVQLDISPDSSQEFLQKQREDKKLGEIIRSLEGANPSKNKISDEFYLEKGLLWHYSMPKTGDTRRIPIEQLVVPESMITEVLTKCHDSVAVAHPGFSKTFERVRSKFYFDNMYSITKNHVETCHSCISKRGYHPKQKAGLIRAEITSRPFERVAMDIVGPLVTTYSGNRFILVITDYFTRFPEAYALPDTKSETIAKVLVEKFIATHGIPDKILTDRGTNFLSQIMMSVYERLGIKKQNTSSYHPQCNGLVEKLNRTLTQSLSHLVSETHENWDECLPFALLAMRTSVHASTGETPAYLVYGRDLVLPYHLLGNPPLRTYASELEYCDEVTNRLNLAFEVVKANLEKAADSQEKQRAKVAVDKKITLGNRVYLYTPAVKPGRNRKLSKLCKGPYRVTKKLSSVNYEITLISDPRHKENVHVDRLTKVKDRKEFPGEDCRSHSPKSKEKPQEVICSTDREEEEEIAEKLLPLLGRRRNVRSSPPVTAHSPSVSTPARTEPTSRMTRNRRVAGTPSVQNSVGAPTGNILPETHYSGYSLRPRDGRGFVSRPP